MTTSHKRRLGAENVFEQRPDALFVALIDAKAFAQIQQAHRSQIVDFTEEESGGGGGTVGVGGGIGIVVETDALTARETDGRRT